MNTTNINMMNLALTNDGKTVSDVCGLQSSWGHEIMIKRSWVQSLAGSTCGPLFFC